MLNYVLFSLLMAATCVVAMRPLLRRTFRTSVATTDAAAATPAEAPEASEEIAQELPAELQHLPEPPVLSEATVEILDRAAVLRRLRELELGVPNLGKPNGDHERIVESTLTTVSAAVSDAATQARYTPRRPNLLPQLMRALGDEEMSRRTLAALIARDPALVGSLLKMANSAFYRVTSKPVESVERAVVILGSDGLRSLIAAALMQPNFQVSATNGFPRFPELVWEHALRSSHAAIPHAALVERVDAFNAELLCLINGLAEIMLFRAAMDYYAENPRRGQPDPLVIASLLETQAPTFAWQIGAGWELSELMLAALEEQMVTSEPTTPLGRSLRFGRLAGALAVLHTNSAIDDASVRLSLPEAGLSPAHLKIMWARLLSNQEDPRVANGRKVA
jgi:HD-like signal output (HDOD) protein